jgi:DNA-binding NarL/FixJ family response regulator
MTPVLSTSPSNGFTLRFLEAVDPLLMYNTLTSLGYRVEFTYAPVKPPLSLRERQVLDGIAAGHPDKFIAADLGIRPRTVRYHLQRIMEKLGAQNRTSAAVMAREQTDAYLHCSSTTRA